MSMKADKIKTNIADWSTVDGKIFTGKECCEGKLNPGQPSTFVVKTVSRYVNFASRDSLSTTKINFSYSNTDD